MSEQKATTSSSLHLDPAAAARLLSALDTPTPPPNQPANTGANPVAPPAYIIDRALGSGGGGTVYRAFREGSDRPVALKVLDYSLSLDSEGKPRQSQAAQRAWRELQLLEDLHLPVLPRLLDHGVMPSGRVFFATEFIEGKTLEAFAFSSLPPLGGMGVPPVPTPSTASLPGIPGAPEVPGTRGFADSSPACDEESLSSLALLLARVCDAVQVLHEHGILHRDLKPSNILIDLHGQPVLIDLGIAAIFEYPGGTDLQSVSSSGGAGFRPAFSTLTETGAPIGTPAYMAPEQARGERHRISTRSDVYSLGATAYRILTGATPHDTNTTIHEAIRRVAFDEAGDPRTLSPGLPKPLAAVLLKACNREPEKRYASAAALGADLRRWANGEAVEAVPPGAWERGVRWAGRHPIATTAAACTAIIAVSVGGTWLGIRWLRNQPADLIVTNGESRAVLISRAGDVLSYWDAGRGDGVVFGAYVPSVHATGMPRAFFGMIDQTTPEFESSLVSIDPVSRRVIQSSNPENVGLRLPDAITERRGKRFLLTAATIADVFPETPDPEIIALWYHWPMSPTAILVLDLDLNTLATYWHNGQISSIVWLSKPRVLLAAGVNSEHSWSELGFGGLQSHWPPVIFALKPVNGETLHILDEAKARKGTSLEWYKAVWPPDAADVHDVPVIDLVQTSAAASHRARFTLNLRGEKQGGVGWDIDANGRLFDGLESDSYRNAIHHGKHHWNESDIRLSDWSDVFRSRR